jgi:phosphopantothenoylcysteine decarboxylase/phosphopantothenate--cysteine ligase
MNQEMWAKQATQDNVQTLIARGVTLLGPSSGSQACGDVGAGRLLEPDQIILEVAEQFSTGALAGRHVVITAGPTREPICPVRYISNRSSGKMGYALAEACVSAGAKTTLISGPVSCEPPIGATVINVETTQQMFDASVAAAATADIFIGAAAVVDFKPATVHDRKIKRNGLESMDLSLIPNPDIIASIADSASRPTLVVGFAAETHEVKAYARKKLASKSLDFIFANDVSDQSIGFNSELNAGVLISKDSEITMPMSSKRVLAESIVSELSTVLG